jgi:uncharacterized protein (DUF1015 family)
LCRVEDYSVGIVHRHEETLSGPKADRLELLKATRAHFGQIFMLYSDPQVEVETALAAETGGRPWESVTDEYGTVHAVWRATAPSTIERGKTAMHAKKLSAHGHHRYQTALAYRNYCRSQAMHDERAEYVIMTFIRKESEGLTILPTHRVVHSLPRFDWSAFLATAGQFFETEALQLQGSIDTWGRRFIESLADSGRERPTLGAYAGPGKLALLRLRTDLDLKKLLADLSTSLHRLDVIILHRLLLENVLGIDRQAVREEKNLRYVRDYERASDEVESGKAQLAFLMNPTPIQAVWENALSGQVLPQKSTDFYPKLLSGLTGYWLDNPGGM